MELRGIFSTYTGTIIFANIAVFIGFFIVSSIYDPSQVFSFLALNPVLIVKGMYLWTFVTSMFMHAPNLLVHIVANMVSLMFIGNFVEKLIGKKRFLWLYFSGGIFAGVLFVVTTLLFTPNSINIPAVGASGAIFGLGGLLAVLTPRLPVLVFFVIPMPMWAAMGFLMFGLWAISLGMGLPIGNVAHLGGLLVGLGYGFYLKKKYPRKTKMISNYFTR